MNFFYILEKNKKVVINELKDYFENNPYAIVQVIINEDTPNTIKVIGVSGELLQVRQFKNVFEVRTVIAEWIRNLHMFKLGDNITFNKGLIHSKLSKEK